MKLKVLREVQPLSHGQAQNILAEGPFRPEDQGRVARALTAEEQRQRARRQRARP